MLASVNMKVLTDEEKAMIRQFDPEYDGRPGGIELFPGMYFCHQLEFWTTPGILWEDSGNFSISTKTGEFVSWDELRASETLWDTVGDLVSMYGVADNLEQVVRHYEATIRNPDVRAAIGVYPVWREHQPPHNGWRYHKNGEYIGSQNPQHEYLADDTHIDYVLTFHVYRVSDAVFAGKLIAFDEALAAARRLDEETKGIKDDPAV